MTKETVYVVTDIEADGPVPGIHSMLSFASLAYTTSGTFLESFEANLNPLADAIADPDTMEWWSKRPETWAEVTANQSEPSEVMRSFERWLDSLPGEPVLVAHPAPFDYMWMAWYAWKFLGKRKLGWTGLDIKSYAMATLNWNFDRCETTHYDPAWLGLCEHSHRAIDDARGYANLFFELQRRNHALHRASGVTVPEKCKT